MFNPAVADRTADYMFEGMQNQVRMDEARRIREQQMLQQQVGQAMDALSTAGAAFKTEATKNAAIDGRTMAFEQLAKSDPNLVGGADFAAAVLGEKNRDKRAAMLLTAEEMMPYRQRQALAVQGHQMDLSAQALANQNDRTGQTATVTDPVTGQKVGLYFQNNKQVAPFRSPTAAVTGVQKVDLGGGNFAYFDSRGRPVPKSSVMEGEKDPAAAVRVGALRQKVAGLDGQMAGDPDNKKPGPDWWPFSKTFEQNRAAAAAELKSLEGAAGDAGDGAPVVSPAAAPTAAPAGTGMAAAHPVVKSRAEFDALPSGATYIGANGKKYRKP